MEPRRDEFRDALRWVEQFLTILNPRGFPETLDLINETLLGVGEPAEAAKIVAQNTSHLGHPSLTKLRGLVDQLKV